MAPARPVRPGQASAPPAWNAPAVVGFVLPSVVQPGAIACGRIAVAQVRRTGEEGQGLAPSAAVVLERILTALAALVLVPRLAVLGSIVLTRFGVLAGASRG